MIDIHPKILWQEVADIIGGTFKMTKLKSEIEGSFPSDYYLLKISILYSGLNIEIHSSFNTVISKQNDKYRLEPLRITIESAFQEEFYLYFWRKGFLEKVINSFKFKSGNDEFYNLIGFRTNKVTEVQKFLSSFEIRNIIMNDKTSVFNARTENNKLILNYLALNVETKETLLNAYYKYIKLIDGLKEILSI